MYGFHSRVKGIMNVSHAMHSLFIYVFIASHSHNNMSHFCFLPANFSILHISQSSVRDQLFLLKTFYFHKMCQSYLFWPHANSTYYLPALPVKFTGIYTNLNICIHKKIYTYKIMFQLSQI